MDHNWVLTMGFLKAIHILMESDAVSDAWPECIGPDKMDDNCVCIRCKQWLDFLAAKETIYRLAQEL